MSEQNTFVSIPALVPCALKDKWHILEGEKGNMEVGYFDGDLMQAWDLRTGRHATTQWREGKTCSESGDWKVVAVGTVTIRFNGRD